MRHPQSSGTRRRSLEVSSTTFLAHPPNLQFWPLMDMDFAKPCPLVRPALPHIRFLYVGSRFCSTLPSDSSSRFCPCASLDFTSIRLSGDFHPQVIERARHTGRCAPPPAVACGLDRREPAAPLTSGRNPIISLDDQQSIFDTAAAWPAQDEDFSSKKLKPGHAAKGVIWTV